MGRNSDRVELFRDVLEKALMEHSSKEMTEDLDYLNMALNIALIETSYEEPFQVKNIYGYPCIVTRKSMFLVKPIVNNQRFSTLEPTGRYLNINDEQLLDKLVFESETASLLPKVITVKIWSSLGLISKDDDDFQRTRGIPFRKKLHYYKTKIFEL